MKIFIIAIVSASLFIKPSFQKEDPAPACHNLFEAREKICSKFNFIINPTAVDGGCINPTNGTTFYDMTVYPKVDTIDPHTVKMASLITNVFEEGDTSFAYAQCADIGDSRGYTSGYVGFTTGTGDAEILISAYEKTKPGNSLSKYLGKLGQISELPNCDRPSRGKVNGLKGYKKAWKKEACSKDQTFAKLQREWVYNNYMIPSARYAAHYKIESALGRAIFYDTIVQHGYQYVEPDINIVRILTLVGDRAENESEQSFLTRFLTIRRQLQCCYPDDVWRASATRCEDLQSLVKNFRRNKDLKNPFKLINFGITIRGNESLDKMDERCNA